MPDSESMYPIKTNIGTVSSGYQFRSLMLASNPSSYPPVPHSHRAKTLPMNPIAPNTRCPVRSMSIMPPNIRNMIIS